MPIALTGVFSREIAPVFDESNLATVVEESETGSTDDQSLSSEEDAKSRTAERVRRLWNITDRHSGNYASRASCRYLVWLINKSSQTILYREVIAQTLCQECYTVLAVSYLLRETVEEGFSDDQDRFKFARNLLGSLINFSDCSREFRQNLLENGAVEQFITFLGDSPTLKNEAQKDRRWEDVLRYLLAVLMNLAKMSKAKRVFNECNATESLQRYLDFNGHPAVKGIAAICIASISKDTNESAALLAKFNISSILLSMLKEALNEPGRRYQRSISSQELAEGIKILASSDHLKNPLIDGGLLDLAANLVNSIEPIEKYYGIDILWTLCFGELGSANCKKIAANTASMNALADAANSPDTPDDIRELAKRALAYIKGWENALATASSNEPDDGKSASKKGLIMISYQWKYKKNALRICDLLKSNDYDVWIDDERMGPNILDDMAKAVKKADLVVIGYSESYRRSPNCRAEAEFAWQQKRKILGIRLEKGYQPDEGWLAMLVNPKMWIDGSEEIESIWFEKAAGDILFQVQKHMAEDQEENFSLTKPPPTCIIL